MASKEAETKSSAPEKHKEEQEAAESEEEEEEEEYEDEEERAAEEEEEAADREEGQAASPLDELADEMDRDIERQLEQRPDNPALPCDFHALRVFSLFDGHGGAACAKRASLLMNRFLMQRLLRQPHEPTMESLQSELERVFADFHREHCSKLSSGATASLVVVCRRLLAVATIGDSRVVVFERPSAESKKLELLWESPQHNTDNDDERRRLQQEGVRLEQQEPGDVLRFGSGLSVTRTLGDKETREVTRVPDVFMHERQEGRAMVVVMATDGLWDVVTTPQINNLLQDRCASVAEFLKVAPLLCRQAYDEGSDDNISVEAIALGLFNRPQ